MTRRTAGGSAPIVEPSVIVPLFVDGLSAMQTVGVVTHLIFTTRQTNVWEGSQMERVVQARLVVPTDQLDAIGKLLLAGRVESPTGVDDAGDPVGIH